MLALDPQRLAARRQDMDMRRGARRSRAASGAAAAMTCSQLSRISSIRLSRRYAIRLGRRIVGLRRQAQHQQRSTVITRSGSLSAPRSTKSAAPANVSSRSMRDRDRNGGLADAARADDRDEARAMSRVETA